MARTMMDIGLDEAEDLLITGGDFAITESTAQHQRQLILNNKGDFKEQPTIGVGAFGYLSDESQQELIRAISIEFCRDGMEVKEVAAGTAGVIRSNAFYK